MKYTYIRTLNILLQPHTHNITHPLLQPTQKAHIITMADPSLYTYPSPLAGWENSPPLPTDISSDGKSYVNPETGVKSKSYEKFPEPLDTGKRGGLYVFVFLLKPLVMMLMIRIALIVSSDVHIYHFQKNPEQAKFARELWERIRRECRT